MQHKIYIFALFYEELKGLKTKIIADIINFSNSLSQLSQEKSLIFHNQIQTRLQGRYSIIAHKMTKIYKHNEQNAHIAFKVAREYGSIRN